MNKTLRNKALSDINRLIVADYNGKDWAAPDGFFATAYPIYDGYKVKKAQQEWQQPKPDLTKILPATEYLNATQVIRDHPLGERIMLMSVDVETEYTVMAKYFDLLMNIYPNATVQISADGNPHAPVYLKLNNELVAVIMPLKQ